MKVQNKVMQWYRGDGIRSIMRRGIYNTIFSFDRYGYAINAPNDVSIQSVKSMLRLKAFLHYNEFGEFKIWNRGGCR